MSTNIELDEIDENENNPLMLEKKAAEEQGRRKRRAIWLFNFWMGILSFGFLVILAILHFFVGFCQVFSVKFTFASIVDWLLNLPSVAIIEPEAQLARFIIGSLFCVVYIIISIRILVNVIKCSRLISPLFESKYRKIDGKKVLFDIFERTSTSYCAALLFGLLAATTVNIAVNVVFIFICTAYAHFFVLATIKNNLERRRAAGEENFERKSVVWDTIKDVLLVVFACALMIVCFQPQFFIFTQNIMLHYQNKIGFTGIAVIERFIFPFIKLFVWLNTLFLFRQTIIIAKRKMPTTNVAFYGKVYQFKGELSPFQKKAKGRMVCIIIFSCICLALSVLFVCITPAGFQLPEDMAAFVLANIMYPISIALAIVTYVLLKKRENRNDA